MTTISPARYRPRSGTSGRCVSCMMSLAATFFRWRNAKMHIISDCWKQFVVSVFRRLHGNKLAGVIPASLGRLTKLVELELQENMLTGTVPLEVLSLVLVGDLTELWVVQFVSRKKLHPLPSSTYNIFSLHAVTLPRTVWPALSNHLNQEVGMHIFVIRTIHV